MERGCVAGQPQHDGYIPNQRNFEAGCGWSRTTWRLSGIFRQPLTYHDNGLPRYAIARVIQAMSYYHLGEVDTGRGGHWRKRMTGSFPDLPTGWINWMAMMVGLAF